MDIEQAIETIYTGLVSEESVPVGPMSRFSTS